MENEVKKTKDLLPIKELTAEQLHFYCKEEFFDFETTATVPQLQGMIGQERAVKAVEFGCILKIQVIIFLFRVWLALAV